MAKLSLDERLNQIEKKISDQSFRSNKGLGNEVGYYVFDYDPREELHVRNHIQYLKNRINESSLGFLIIEIDLFHLMIQVLEEEGYLEAFFDLERENGFFDMADSLVETLGLDETDERNLIISKIVEELCDNRFAQLKANEEELNRIFIDIYGLQDELTPEVEEKDITVRKADLGRDIRSFISYAVGCMFGRYSIYEDGLMYAGGDWDYSKYKDVAWRAEGRPDVSDFYTKTHYMPDYDNIIPITDEEYFSDDIVGRFVEFVETVYGKDTLEENLDFIAQALGNKGNSSREVIRNYFIKDFYKDHLKVYQKRPIYWLFDSGKQNGFKALIYMHRYDADTVGRVRTDYLHRAQNYVETAMKSAEYTIENTTVASEKSKAMKAVSKYTKQLAEMQTYDQAIAHVANQRIEIDLDDGVKVNYAKFQGVEVAQEGKQALKVDLLAKI